VPLSVRKQFGRIGFGAIGEQYHRLQGFEARTGIRPERGDPPQ
jgi:hypothetical protein